MVGTVHFHPGLESSELVFHNKANKGDVEPLFAILYNTAGTVERDCKKELTDNWQKLKKSELRDVALSGSKLCAGGVVQTM